MTGHSLISTDILASYAADAAREIVGVRGVVEGARPRHNGVKVIEDDGSVSFELHLAVEWGASVRDLGPAVQRRVADYLGRMADVKPARIDVFVEEVGPPPAGR